MFEEKLRAGTRKRQHKGAAVTVAAGMARHSSPWWHTSSKLSKGDHTAFLDVKRTCWKEREHKEEP